MAAGASALRSMSLTSSALTTWTVSVWAWLAWTSVVWTSPAWTLPVSSTGARSPDPEVFELRSPHLILECEYRQDSAGAGTWRGGHGGHYRVRFTSDAAAIILEPSSLTEETAPLGIAGGAAGLPAGARIVKASGQVVAVDRPMLFRPEAGDVLETSSSGGGGYGDPRRRSPELVRADVVAGLLSIGKAREAYGVALDPSTLQVDAAATRRLREGASA